MIYWLVFAISHTQAASVTADEPATGKEHKLRFGLAGFFLEPDPTNFPLDEDPASHDSRKRRAIDICFIRMLVGQSCVPWKLRSGGGMKMKAEHLAKSFLSHATRGDRIASILKYGLMPGRLSGWTGAVELQLSPFPSFDPLKRAQAC